MTDRGPDYQRMADRTEQAVGRINDRLEEFFDRTDRRFDRMERDIAKGEGERSQILNELAEVRRDMGEQRDALQLVQGRVDEKTIRAAAEGAASGAVPAVKQTVQQTFKDFFTGPRGFLLTLAAAIAAAGTVIDTGPRVARAVDKFWNNITAEPEKADAEPKAK